MHGQTFSTYQRGWEQVCGDGEVCGKGCGETCGEQVLGGGEVWGGHVCAEKRYVERRCFKEKRRASAGRRGGVCRCERRGVVCRCERRANKLYVLLAVTRGPPA